LQRCERRGHFLLRWFDDNAKAAILKKKGAPWAEPEKPEKHTRLCAFPYKHRSAFSEGAIGFTA